MAKLVSVVKSGDHTYAKRQMPLVVEDNVTVSIVFERNTNYYFVRTRSTRDSCINVVAL